VANELDHADERTLTESGLSQATKGGTAGWPFSIGLGVLIAFIYLSSDREKGAFDTVPNTLLPLAVLRGDGVYLDRFRALFVREWGTPTPIFVAVSRGHLVSRYPIGPGLLAVPFYLPQVAYLDRAQPGWDRSLVRAYAESRMMGKRTAALLTALAAVALHRLLIALGLTRAAAAATLATALGSGLWSVGSQALWPHGPAALFLTLLMLALSREPVSRTWLVLGGLAAAMLVVVRSIDLIFALVALAWVIGTQPRRVGWFLPAPLVLGLLLVGSNLYFFDSVAGGQDEIERHHRILHGVEAPWSGNLRDGMMGTLFSPSRGLFVYSPWVLPALAVLPGSFRLLRRGSVARWLVFALIPYLVLLSKYAVWWGGGTFGARYWTDALPILGIIFAVSLTWAYERARMLLPVFVLGVVVAIVFHAIGAFCYPSSWNFYPTDIDIDHRRLWDWRDTELSRCVRESVLGRPVPVRVPGR
jgi:hypothetical protein